MFKPKSSILFLSLIVLLTLGLIFVGCDEVEEEIEEDLNGEAKDEDVIDEDAIDEDAQYLLDELTKRNKSSMPPHNKLSIKNNQSF